MVKQDGSSITSLQLKEILGSNATRTLTWSKVSANPEYSSTYYSSIKDWDGETTQLFHLDSNEYGLEIRVNRGRNKLYVEAVKHSYKNIHVYIIGFDGSDYDFSLFDVKEGKVETIDYPANMDELLPINRISLWFELDEAMTNVLLDDKKIQNRLQLTMKRV